MAKRTDGELIAAARHDDKAFRELYDRYSRSLHAFFARRTRDSDVALDLTAETFAQAWLSRHRFRDTAGGSAGPWLYTIARRVLVRSVERARLERSARDRLSVEVNTGAVPSEEWLDGLDADLARALDELSEQNRRALELRVLDDLSYASVAAELDCTPLAARIRVSRSLARLRTLQESASMIAGVTLFHGSQPDCVSRSATSFRCTLASTPLGQTFLAPDGSLDRHAFLGLKMETVDATHHVDGGCVSVAADGLTWDCYLGQAAVDHGIVGQQFLGTRVEGPAAG